MDHRIVTRSKKRSERYLSLKSLKISPSSRANTKKYRSFFILSFAREQLCVFASRSIQEGQFLRVTSDARALCLSKLCSAGKREFELKLEGTRKKLSPFLSFKRRRNDETLVREASTLARWRRRRGSNLYSPTTTSSRSSTKSPNERSFYSCSA